MKKTLGWISAATALALSGVVFASRPSMDECFEASEFIGNAALSRDGGMPAEAFLGRMREDFVLIRAFPNELRWFVHDPDDESFLFNEAREVFDHPESAEAHRRAFLRVCIERLAGADPADSDQREPAQPVAHPGRT